MANLVTQIQSFTQQTITKQEKIVLGVTTCIQEDLLSYGDILPSVNKLSGTLGYARETVVKAYGELKERGLISSKQGLGYFVSNESVDQRLSIGLVLYGFQTFQQDFYNTFRKCLGENYHIDVFFHHNNLQMYESILNTIRGKYGMYVVAPIQSKRALPYLEDLPSDKLLVIDRYQYINDQVSSISQEFEASMTRVFESLKEEISKFTKTVLYYQTHADYPKGIMLAAERFFKSSKMALEVYEEYDDEHLAQGVLYCTIGDTDLWSLLKGAKKAKLELGKDIGVLSHNDSPVKEIIEGGITTFSTDFRLMASDAAEFVKNRKPTNKIIPSEVIRRKSL